MGIVARESEGFDGLPFSTLAYIDSLLHTSTLQEDYKQQIEFEAEFYSEEEAGDIIDFLLEHQKESLDKQYDRIVKNDSTADNY
jgi:hypothetical protein